jgi:amino acid adenylation domain-containing protein
MAFVDSPTGTATCDLSLALCEQGDHLSGRFEYSTDLFDATSIHRMIGHLETLLVGISNDPECTLARLPLLTAWEIKELVVRLNDTAATCPYATLVDWFDAQAKRTPEAIAIDAQAQRWRYAELSDRIDRVAVKLRRAGVRGSTLVAIAMERSPAMVAGLLAILKAGGTYLPLDPDLPPGRLAMLLEDARPTVILAEPTTLNRLPESGARIVLFEDNACPAPPQESDNVCVDAAGIAYVLYTSGSTAKPKAVEITHHSLVNLLTAMQRELDFKPDDRLLAVTTISFDIAALELFLPLVSGATLIIAAHDDAKDPVRLESLLKNSRCTVMQATPATWRGLTTSGWSGARPLKIVCGGDVMSPDLARSLLDRGGAVWNVYGPTETTIWSLAHRVAREDGPVPIGRPLSNTQVYVLDRYGAVVPAGVCGELYIAGDGLARGYRGDETLTAGKFLSVPDPMDGTAPAVRMYRTGDLAKYRPDGTVEFLGRNDHQIKIRGFRVGLEEIESVLASHPAVTGAAVRASRDRSGEQTLTAFVVGDGLRNDQDGNLREYIRQMVPAYMVPARFVVLDSLPLTPNGKLDRKRLPDPGPARSVDTTRPRDALECGLVELWKELLDVPDVGLRDNFFDLGGHSLLAFTMLARIKALWHRELPLATLFYAPTVEELADTIRSPIEPAFDHLVALRPRGTGRPLFIVHGIFGNVLHLKNLADNLRTDRPVYALQARGADPRQEPHRSIADMARAYISVIRTVQASGPYALAGYSFGGLIAYEMACRLRDSKENVDVLSIFESDLHESCLLLPARLAYEWAVARRIMGKILAMPVRQVPSYLNQKLWKILYRLLAHLRLVPPALALDGTTGALSDRLWLMYNIGSSEIMKFRPRRFDGRLSVFRTVHPMPGCDPLPIWRRVAGDVDVYQVAGEHGTIMDYPHVLSTAEQLSRCLDRADKDGGATPRADAPLPACQSMQSQEGPCP